MAADGGAMDELSSAVGRFASRCFRRLRQIKNTMPAINAIPSIPPRTPIPALKAVFSVMETDFWTTAPVGDASLVLETLLDDGLEVVLWVLDLEGFKVLPEELELLTVVLAVELRVVDVSTVLTEVETAVKNVLVLPSPSTPIIVWASPSGIENVPLLFWQSHVPVFAAGPQHQLLPPQYCNDPLFSSTGLSTSFISNFQVDLS
jgi:hypothetical protein